MDDVRSPKDTAADPVSAPITDSLVEDCDGPVTSLNLYEYAGLDKIWIFMQMGLAHIGMRRSRGISPLFYKLVGSGSDLGFNPKPDWSRYGVLATWRNLDDARNAQHLHPVLSRWKNKAVRTQTFLLKPTRSSGNWSGVQPFPVTQGPKNGDGRATNQKTNDTEPVAVITRARLKLSVLKPFWRHVPEISRQIAGAEGREFQVGLGEIPWVHQITFSIWRDPKAIRTFAYQAGAHADAITASRDGNWFAEDLFARFQVLEQHSQN